MLARKLNVTGRVVSIVLFIFCSLPLMCTCNGGPQVEQVGLSFLNDENNTYAVEFDTAVPENCNLSKAVIVMSYGLSGSTYVSDVVGRPFVNNSYQGREAPNFGEIFGPTMRYMQRVRDPLKTMQNWLCKGHGQYISFKWKPAYWNNEYMKALKWVAYHQIPVVYNVRNIIDILLSSVKHERKNNIPWRCGAQDENCIKTMKRHEKVYIDPTTLISKLEDASHLLSDESILGLLVRLKVHFIDVKYESLSSSDNEVRLRVWREVFEFISPEKNWDNLSVADIHSSLAKTSSSSHKDKMKNYEQIRAILRGTRFASQLN